MGNSQRKMMRINNLKKSEEVILKHGLILQILFTLVFNERQEHLLKRCLTNRSQIVAWLFPLDQTSWAILSGHLVARDMLTILGTPPYKKSISPSDEIFLYFLSNDVAIQVI